MKAVKYWILFRIGGLAYCGIEVLWRGWSHWTMFLLGGLCFVSCGFLNEILPWETPLILQLLMGGGIITALEFVTGCIVNLWLNWSIWDYSARPLNLCGQICLRNSLLWCLMSLVAIFLDDFIRWKVFGEEKPRYRLLKKNYTDFQ